MKKIVVMNFHLDLVKIRTFLLFISIKFLILICAGKECEVKEKCSGEGSKWNPQTKTCDCAPNLWGYNCEFGRKRFTSQTGHFVESPGNYRCNSKYMYLIDSGRTNVSIQIKLNQFATECNWDYLFIFDGRSIYDPLIASYSGIIKTQNSWVQVNNTTLKSVTAKSGAAYLYFYSDALFNDIGFNVSYIISNCTNEQCHGNGICSLSGTCQCEEGWSGLNCTTRLCCREVISLFHPGKRHCSACENDFPVAPRASHAVAVSGHIMYVYGGYSFSKDIANTGKIIKYNLGTQEWIHTDGAHLPTRYGHSMICDGDHLIVYGGNMVYDDNNITNELWKYTIQHNSWEILTPKGATPKAVYGHASVYISVHSSMYTFFGFSKEELYTQYVQKYDIAHNKWSIVDTNGAIVNGRFGHSATYDHTLRTVFLFGGFYSKNVDSKLLLFHVPDSKWSMSDAFTQPRMLHAAGIIERNLVMYGGNEHRSDHSVTNDQNKCFSSSLMVYDIDRKQTLKKIPKKKEFEGKERYGHSAVIYNKSMHVFGGFDGTFKSDVFQIRISGDCFAYKTKDDCLNAPVVAGCMWSKDSNKCIPTDTLLPESSVKKPVVPAIKSTCGKYKECIDCTNHACSWDGRRDNKDKDQCQKHVNINVIMNKNISDPLQCGMVAVQRRKCSINSGCVACSRQQNCSWDESLQKCVVKSTSSPASVECFKNNVTSCEDIKSCDQCIDASKKQCMWCESGNICLHSKSYKVRNPYGQCLEWISANHDKDLHDCKAVLCEDQKSCSKCLQIAACGWCEDTTGTGLGTCMQGSDYEPIGNKTCPASRWSFTNCPACHCNGHSKCIEGTDNCTQCHGNVEGKHCDKCKFGYFGNPENNNTCEKCFCNGHFSSCDSTDGRCKCNLVGAAGVHCGRCSASHYGKAANGGMCYVNLSVGYMYENRNLTDGHVVVGYRVSPQPKRDKQITFKIERTGGSLHARLNLSIYYGAKRTSTTIKDNYSLTKQYTKAFTEKDYDEYPGEIRAVIFGISEDEFFSFKITVTNPPPLFNLIYFLIMFLVCFCSLLIILIVLWKIKQRYDIYVHNRQQRHEHAERISRPFRSISIYLHDNISYLKVPPSLIVCEQFATGNLAVASVIIELPRAGNGFSPTDHSGICIGSTLVTTPQRWTFTQMQQKYGCDRRRRKNVERAVAV